MIAKSDLIILLVSSFLLSIAVLRWDHNTSNVSTSTVLANSLAQPTSVNSDSLTTASNSNAPSLGGDTESPLNNDVAEPLSSTTLSADIAPEAVAEPAPLAPGPALRLSVHVVRSGESLSEIAADYNTSAQELRDLNGITGSKILIGQEIFYPASQ